MIEQMKCELLELARAIRRVDDETILERMAQMEKRLLAAIKNPSNINLEPLTEKLKTANESLDATVKSNQPT